MVRAETPTDVPAIGRGVGVSLEARSGPVPIEVQQQIEALLAEPISLEGAVRVALLNSNRIQALLQELRITRAELVAGRSLPNPEIEANIRRGEEKHTEIAVLLNVNRIIFHPLKKRQADAVSAAAGLRLADALLEEITRVKVAFIGLQSLLHVRAIMNSAWEADEAGAEMAARQRTAGNINRLEQSLQEALRQEARLVRIGNDAEIRIARERLAGILGVRASSVNILPVLPDIPPVDPTLEELERNALLRRPDLAAARKEEQAARHALRLARQEIFPSLSAGVIAEKDQHGRGLSGPVVAMEIPLFDFGFPARAKAQARRNQTRHATAAVITHLSSEMRAAHERLVSTRLLEVHIRESVLPLRVQMLEDTLRNYNYMLTGVFQLLEIKKAELSARRELIEARRDYWMAWLELERTAGGFLEIPPVQKAQAQSKSPTEGQGGLRP